MNPPIPISEAENPRLTPTSRIADAGLTLTPLSVTAVKSVKLPAGSDLAISLFLPAQTIHQLSQHGGADQISYTAPGNVVGAKTLDSPTEIRSWPFVKGVDVKVSAQSAAMAHAPASPGGSASTRSRRGP